MKKREELIKARNEALAKMSAASKAESFVQADFDNAKNEVDKLTAQIETLDIENKFAGQTDAIINISGDINNSEKEFERNAFWSMAKGNSLSSEEFKALSTVEGSKGGFLVPESFADTIIMKSAEQSYIRDLATVSTSTHTENVPVEGDDGENGWIDEEGTYPESDPTIGKVQLAAWKTGRIVKVTDEALDDTVPAIEGYVAMKFTKSTVKAEEYAFVNGDGVKKPTGFLVTATIGKTTASSNAIAADEILDLMGSLDSDYEGNAYLMMNKNTRNALRKLKDSTGQYLWVQGFQGNPDTFDGKPIRINKHMPDIAAGSKPIAYGDFSYYHIKDRKIMTLKRLDEIYSTTGHVGFRIDKRVDGKLVLADAIKTLKMA